MSDQAQWHLDAGSPLLLVNRPTRAPFLDDIANRMARTQGFSVATLNLDHIVKLRADPAFAAAYRDHTHVVADGNPVVWMCRLAGRIVELIPGSELIDPLCARAARAGVGVALIGSTEATLTVAAARLEQRHSGLNVVFRLAPPFGFDPGGASADQMVTDLAKSGAGLCFLALGAPKQERLAARLQGKLPRCGFVSIGAGLDFIAGTQTRAPALVRRLALEWLWRLLNDPRRMYRRYAACVAILPGLVVQALKDRRKG